MIRDNDGLAGAVRGIADIETHAATASMRNMATTALLVATAAWARRESRGAHDRSDYPAELTHAQRTTTTLTSARAIATSLGAERAEKIPLMA